MPDSPIGRVVRNLVALQRLGTGVSREAEALLRELFDDLVAEIARRDPGSEASVRRRLGRLSGIMEGVEGASDEAFERVLERIESRMAQIGVQQGRWTDETLRLSLGEDAVRLGVALETGVVSPEFVRTVIRENPFEGKVLSGWVDTQKAATVERVRRQVRLGMIQEETLGDIVRRVRGRQSGGRFVGGVLEATTRETEAITRTAINHTANASHRRVYEANSDVVTEVEYTATLDSRTTLICASLDGTRWPTGSSDIDSPPQHYGCRSVLQPVIDWDGIGVEPPEGALRPSKTFEVDDNRLSETGAKQVAASTTYSDWFRSQPAAVQDKIIGPTRARLFRGGKVDFQDMITRDNRVVNVGDLPGGKGALEAVQAGT